MEEVHTTVPQCIGFIMDGNRRWAHARGLSAAEGHAAGYEAFKRCLTWGRDRRVAHLAFYAFSSENWCRDATEVSVLLSLLAHALDELVPEATRLRVIGDRTALPEDLRTRIEAVEFDTVDESDLTIWIALSYGGRGELVRAANAAVAGGEPVTEAGFATLLDTAEMPDPDVVVRTGGEQRLSNFLLWQSAYSELYFTHTYWPDMTESDFDAILSWYETRHRRFGS